jgi:apolipoprotein D and lipocalin family protein
MAGAVDLAADYSDTIIGIPNREHVWIMASTPQVSEARYQQLLQKVKSLGYKISKLQKIPQQAVGSPILDQVQWL